MAILARQSHVELLHIYRFAGLEPAPNFRRDSVSDFHILGNVARFQMTNGVVLYYRWRTELRASHSTLFTRFAGQQNEKYGYGG